MYISCNIHRLTLEKRVIVLLGPKHWSSNCRFGERLYFLSKTCFLHLFGPPSYKMTYKPDQLVLTIIPNSVATLRGSCGEG